MKTVYVEITDNYSRTVWDNTGATNYVASDRVEYNDGSQNIIFVCITDNNSTTTPDVNTSDWVEAGSEKYPFLVSSAISTTNFCNLDDTTSSLGEYALYSSGTNFAVEAAGSQGEIILGDGEYRWTRTKGASYIHPNFNNVNIKAKNQLKAYIRGHFTQYNNCARAENLVLVNEYTPWNYVFGRNSGTPSSLIGCLITQETPTFKLKPVKQESSSSSQSRPISSLATGSIIKNCTFDFSYFGPSYWFSTGNVLITVENNTFYARVKHNQYVAVQSSGGAVFKNNIFYYKYLNDSHADQNFHNGMASQGTNILYVENPVSAAGGSIINNIPDGQTINPLFIDADNGNFSLRPSSPLIGGVKEQNELLQKYPNGLWVDHNHSPTQASYNYTLDSGDGNNYTFSGDATGTDPVLSANIQDTLTFTNNTGGHPLAIYNSQGVEVASESGGATTFTPKYPDTYYYQCTVSGHENMRGDIVISMGTLGTESNPFSNYQHAIDARAYTGSCDLLFKEGDHPMNGGGGPNGLAFESSYTDGIRFIGSNAKSTRLVSLDTINAWPMLYNNPSRNDINGTISGSDFYFIDIGIHINNTTGYVNRSILGTFRNLTMRGCIFSATSTANIYGPLISYPLEWFDAKGCIFNLPLGKYPGGDMWWFGSDYGITRYRIESCCFLNLSGYRRPTYENNAFFGPYADANSYFKNNIAYSDIADMHSVVHYNGADFQIGWWATNWTGNLYYNSAVDFSNTPNTDSEQNIVTDPLFVDLTTENEDFRLKANSPAIGGVKKQETNVYYLQPGNPFNGDGSQKDASAMTADGDPGPFNNFKEIVAAGVPYGSKIIIVNGTYAWPNNFHYKFGNSWELLTYEGYHYIAETTNEVIFDANKQQKYLGYQPYGGTPGSGTYLDLDTSFTGIQFNNVVGGIESNTRNQVFTRSSSAGFGSCTFNNCKFLGWINTAAGSSYPWTGGGRSQYGSTMHWKGCVISIAFDYAGGLLSGGDGFANDAYHGAWSWENCTFYIPVGLTTFNGRNAANGTYQSPSLLFGNNYNQSQRIFENNILYIPGGNTSTGTTSVNNLPSMKNNCLVGVVPQAAYFDFINDNNLLDVDPKFINPEDNNFKLRPNSLLVGRGA